MDMVINVKNQTATFIYALWRINRELGDAERKTLLLLICPVRHLPILRDDEERRPPQKICLSLSNARFPTQYRTKIVPTTREAWFALHTRLSPSETNVPPVRGIV